MTRTAASAGVAVALVLSAGCSNPLRDRSERSLHDAVLDATRREIAEAQEHPGSRQAERPPMMDTLGIREEFMPELERMAGPSSYDPDVLELSPDLLGQAQATVGISLEHAIRSAVERNLELQFARLGPAVNEAQVVAAEAAFDWLFFSNFNWRETDEQSTTSGGFGTSRFNQRQDVSLTGGLRRALSSGGGFTIQNELAYSDVETPSLQVSPDPAQSQALVLQFDQPLLRGFGQDVALAEIRLARNAERDAIAGLKRDLLRTVTQTEQAYWALVFARMDLLIQRRLLERGYEVRNQIRNRSQLDAAQAQIAEAAARIESRRANVLRAENALRTASDRLKVLINDPRAPIGSEVLLVPLDRPMDARIEFSLLDLMMSSVRNRPEIQQAILSIDDTSIRQVVARQARLPQLDFRGQVRWSALNKEMGDTYPELLEGDFMSYLIGLEFEQPIGNRAAEANYRRRRLERMQATLSYRNTVQQVIQELKASLRAVETNYLLIEQTRVARTSAAESLRSHKVEKELTGGYTVLNLSEELRRQEALAQSEREEIQSLVDYATALAQLYASAGTALERNRIELRTPNADDALAGRLTTTLIPEPEAKAGESASEPASDSPPADEPAPETPPAQEPGDNPRGR